MSQSPVSMIEIARQLGVSHTTVSRVLNGRPGVSAALADDIRAAMQKSGYRPRKVRRPGEREARETARQTIAFLRVGPPSKNFPHDYAELLAAVSHAANDAGLNLLFADLPTAASAPPWLRQGQVAGVLLSGRSQEPALIAMADRLPSVWLSSHPTSPNAGDRVIAGNHAAGRLAATYLLDRGHERLACLHPLRGWSVYQSRVDAFEITARRQGSDVLRIEAASQPEVPIFDFSTEEIEARLTPLIGELLDASPRPTGLFLPDAPVALAFYRCAARIGLAIGRDVDVVAFGMAGAFTGLYPMPARIDTQSRLRGLRAVHQLIWRIEHPGEARGMEVAIEPVLLPAELPWPPPRD